MDDYWWSVILFRFLLPLVIGIAIFIRPSITSYVYLVVGCYMPFFSVPTKKSMANETGNYMKVLMITCVLTTTFLISFYMAVFFPEDNLDELEKLLHQNTIDNSLAEDFNEKKVLTTQYSKKPCTTIEIALRTLGVIDFRGLSARDVIPWCLPEPLMLFTSVFFNFIFKKLSQDETAVLRATKQADDTSFTKKLSRRKYILMMLHFGKYFVVFLCCLNAVLRSTAFGAVYYFFFLVVITYWACNRSLGRVFAKMLACLIPIIFINITVIFWYQFQYFQDSDQTTPFNIWGRLFNLVDLKTYKDCTDPRLFYFHPHTLATYCVPLCLYVMYMLVVLVAKEILQAKDGCKGMFMAVIKRKPVTFKDRWAKAVLQIHEQKYKKDSLTADKVKAFIEQTLQFIIYISFIAANFVMMLWAIIYVSWKTLILMVWANVIWLLPFRKKLTLYSSPLVVIWVWFILVTSYLYSMELNHQELPPKWGFVNLASGVDQASKYKPFHLLTKSLFAVIIFVTMRQMFQEIQLKKEQKKLASAMGLKQTDIEEPELKFALLERFQKWSLEFFATWWIWVVILTMIWMTFWTTYNVFRIVFVFLATVFITTFQFCPFKPWKKFLIVYWWIVIIYSMVNFFAVYFYQISVTRRYMLQLFPEQHYKRLGFRVWKDPKKTTAALAIPLFFQIAVVIQQHYLHEEFDRITSPTPPEEMAKSEDDVAKSNSDSKWKKMSSALTYCKNMIFKILELRLRHVTLIVGWFMCLQDMCALQMSLAVLFTASCVLGHVFTTIVIYGASFAVQILIVLRLLYMKLVKDHYKWNYVGYYTRNGKSFNKTLNTADWLGFHESRYGYNYADFGQLAWCFLYVFAVTLNRVVSIRMNNYRKSNNESSKPGVLYPHLTYENCHKSFRSMVQFLINYGFYKFGCELSLFFTTVVMMMRMDAGAIAMAFWLMSVYSLNRDKLRIIWLPSLIIIAVFLPFQYWASLAGMPTTWNNSLTKFWNTNDFLLRIQQFCYLLNMAHPPNKERISLDFLLLFLMSRQWRSFRREWKHKGMYFAPGGNEDVSALIDDQNVENPVPDFVTYTRSYLDIVKRGIFNTWFYLTLGITFLCGVLRLTLYSFGYVIITFIFAWEGTDMFLRPPKVIKKRWNMLIAYNIFVMMIKTVSQVFGCIFNYSDYIPLTCRVFQLFSLGCVDKFEMTEGVPNLNTKPVCQSDFQSSGMELDCLCFFFLIVQQRIFKSFHFFHMVNAAKAQTILADRGANFIERARQEERKKLDQDDAQIRKNIDTKLAKIRATHEKVQGEVYQRRLKNHSFVLKSCDYYIFDDKMLAEDIPIIPPKEDKLNVSTNSYDPQPLTEYFGLWQLTDMETVLAERALRRQQKAAILKGQKPEDVTKMVQISDTDIPEKVAARSFKNFLHVLIFTWGFVESFIVTVTAMLNRFTKGFRSILTDMYKDNITLKEQTKYNEGVRLGSNGVWEPTSSFTDILGEVTKNTDPDSDPTIIKYTIYEKLVTSLWYLIWSHTEWICYFIMIYNQLIRSTFISLPLVMLTFCWGSLTVPKPTRTYWVLNIAYVLVILFLKCFMALRLAPWYHYHNSKVFESNQYFPPYSIGVGDNSTVNMNFALLVGFLCHRMVLQSLGLWKTIRSRPTTLIQNGYYNLQGGHLVSASPRQFSPTTLNVESARLGISDLFPHSIFKGFRKYADNFKIFVQELITPSLTQIPVDVYTPMFLCDLVNLILIVFFYGSFHGASEAEGLIMFIQTNTVPLSYIVLILGYFLLMVIDRAIYLKKNRFAKVVFHYFQVFSIHVYFFVLFPMLGDIKFKDTPVVQIFYFFKCLYFLFSAYQIRNGYPPLISFHFLWHGLGVINRYGYKFYRMVPYFFEMRTLLDWICSDSSLSVTDWFKMEEIIQNIFDQRCQQSQEEESVDPLGKARGRTKKYIKGGLLYFLLILTVIFPFLLFSLGDTVGVKTHPSKFKLQLYMGSAEPIFQSYASQKSLHVMSEKDYQNLTGTFNNIEQSEDIFDNFRAEDVVIVTWSPNSLTDWTVSPGAYEELIEDVLANDTLSFRMEIHYTHVGNGGVKVQSTFGQSSHYPPLPNVHRQNLINILHLNQSLEAVVWIPLMFPKFLLIDQKASPVPLTIMGEQADHRIYDEYKEDLSLSEDEDDDSDVESDPKIHRNLLAKLNIDNGRKWWHIEEECDKDDDNYYYYLKDLVHNKCNLLVMYTFNERVFSNSMSFITSSGILGLYLLYFMLVIGIIRDCRIVISQIWIEDLPNSELIYRKCLEVYIARDMQNYELEEELFAELIFIMRSRELMIKLTRYTDSIYNPPIPVKAKSPQGKPKT